MDPWAKPSSWLLHVDTAEFQAAETFHPKALKTLRVQIPNYHVLSKIVTYIATILNPSTYLLGPLDP